MLRNKAFAVYLLLAALPLTAVGARDDALLLSPDAKSELTLRVGEQRVLKVFDTEKISVVNSRILKIRVVDEDEILLIPVKTGTTTFLFWNAGGDKQQVRISVVSDNAELSGRLKEVLGDIENLRISEAGEKVVLAGELLSKEDYDKVVKVTEAFGSANVLNITSLDRGTSNAMLEYMLQKAIGTSTVGVKIVGDKAFLSGEVYSETLKQKAEDLVKTQVNEVSNLIEVRDAIIEVDIVFLQVSSDTDLALGQNLLQPANLSFDLEGSLSRTYANHKLAPTSGDFSVALTDGITQKINAALTRGVAKILSHPRVVTKSGESGHFHSGGDVYYTVTGLGTSDLKNVEYGLLMDVTPVYTGNDIVETSVSVELSVPAQAAAGQALSLDKFSTENTVSCRLNESIVLSGLFQSFINDSSNRVPILGRIPILSFFFNERGKSKQNKELVVVLTPRITRASKRLIGDFVDDTAHEKEFRRMLKEDPSAVRTE